MIKITYSKSLKAKLTLERDFMMESYQALMDVVNTRKDILIISSFPKDRVAYGKNKVALIKAFKKNLVIYYSLDPNKINEKYDITDVSSIKAYNNYPTKLIINSKKDLKNAIKLMEKALDKSGAKEICEAEEVDYNDIYPVKKFDELVDMGLIKKRIKYIDEGMPTDYYIEEPTRLEAIEAPTPIEKLAEPKIPNTPLVKVEMVHVTFKVMIKGKMTDNLYLFDNYTEWNPEKCSKFNKVNDYFILEKDYPKNYNLEFKTSFSDNWNGVEKGIFGEEIKNHSYYLNKDLEIEDIIYNWRKN